MDLLKNQFGFLKDSDNQNNPKVRIILQKKRRETEISLPSTGMSV